MISVTQRGADLEKFVRDTLRDAENAEEQAVRMVASRCAKELRALIKQSFGQEWAVFKSPGFAKAIKVKKMGPGWYRVYSKATYVKGRTQPVDLLWVFETGPQVSSGFGKPGIVVPIPGHAPIASSGRRYMWPSEATAAGWMLDFAPIMGRNSVLILGRRSTHEPWVPLWIWKPSVRMPTRLDLAGLFEKHSATMEATWADIVDGRIAASADKFAA